jgi:hypothetical protein
VPAVYVPDNSDFGKFILSADVHRVAIEAAGDVVKRAVEIAPFDAMRDRPGGHYVDHFKVNGAVAPVVVGGNPRAAAEVYNDSDHAAAIEFGNSRNGGRGQRVLRRAGASVGEMRGEPG